MHGNSRPFCVVIVVGTGSVGGRLANRMFESVGLRARFAAARSVLNKSAAAKTCAFGPRKTVLSVKTQIKISGNVSAIWLNNSCKGAVNRMPP